MFAPGIITSQPTSAQRLKWSEDPGKPSGRVNGGYLADLAGLGKAMWFCARGCARKFNAPAYRYHAPEDLPLASGRCDGCATHSQKLRVFIPQDRTFL